jgi:hypothetical protein
MKKILINTLLIFTSIVISFLILEVGLRFYSGIPILSNVNFVSRSLDIVRANSGALDFDPLLGWRLKDDIGTLESGFSTTRFGIRNNGPERLPLPTKAVLAVGDSFTAGSGVRDEETWPAQLEQQIRKRVINGAAGAWGVDQMVLRAETLSETLIPSTVIVGILAQDSLRNSYDLYGGGYKPWFKVIDGKPVLQGVPVPRFENSTESLSKLKRVFGHSWLVQWSMNRLGRLDRWVDNAHRYRAVMSNEDGVAVSCALMQRLESIKNRYGSEIIIVLLWGAQESSEDKAPWYGPPVIECAQKAGYGIIDLYPILHEISKADPERFKQLWIDENGVLGHPSAEGNKITASLLREQFLKITN